MLDGIEHAKGKALKRFPFDLSSSDTGLKPRCELEVNAFSDRLSQGAASVSDLRRGMNEVK